ncbi:DUF1269 domain-containing protein [Poseidonocella sp. HB161398]|uniref:DUF1269 domain-containing protein n=1 Tax=Poseidonocella sp. HB161398 TaxID=2320855 RepID=UPI00110843B9|nr:DUF1269 domain-containing protein [Poseidonocella sp. HB161398]
MADLIVVSFPDEATGFELRAELIKLQKEYLLEIEDAVVVTRTADGEVKLHQEVNLTAAGAVGGAFWGLLIGVVFLNPLLGVAAGAGAGALSGALTDLGVNDKFMKEMGGSLAPGGSQVFILLRKVTGDKVLERLEAFRAKGKVLQTSLTRDDEASLRALLEDNALPLAGGAEEGAPV